MRFYLFTYLFFSLAACGQSKNNSNNNKLDSTPGNNSIVIQKKIITPQDYIPTFDKAHPNAKALMYENFYFDMLDETSPFGSDDGADAFAGFHEWRPTHKNKDPKEFFSELIDRWHYAKFDITQTEFSMLKPYLLEREFGSRMMSGIDAAIVAIAFGQLYMEGMIEKNFKETAKTALKRQLIPELLAYWGDPYKDERKSKLKKMLAALNK